MSENPYSGILNMMQSEGAKLNPPIGCLGEILSVNPLKIKVDELILEPEDLLVSDILLSGYTREMKVESAGKIQQNGNISLNGELNSSTNSTSGGSGDASFASHSHDINNSAILNNSSFTANSTYMLTGDSKVEFKPYLKKGDLLYLMPLYEGQLYIVLCKAVKLT